MQPAYYRTARVRALAWLGGKQVSGCIALQTGFNGRTT